MATKNNGYSTDGYIPDGQTSRGTPGYDSTNPKNASQRRRNGVMADDGDSGQMQTTATGTTTSRTTNIGVNSFNRGSQNSVPDPAIVNTNYAPTGDQVPSPTNVSAYRSYDVEPVEYPSPNGDMREAPAAPKLDRGQAND